MIQYYHINLIVKTVVDIVLLIIQDQPTLKGYISHNYDNNDRQANSIRYWVKNMKLSNWNYKNMTAASGNDIYDSNPK